MRRNDLYMLELLLGALCSLGVAEVQNIITLAGELVVKKYKTSHNWKKLFVGTGQFFIKNEGEEEQFFEDLEHVLSKKNLSQLATELKNQDGYDLKSDLYNSFMKLMRKYEIPYETAEEYTMKLIYELLEQLKTIDPDRYEHYFLQEWKDEQEKSLLEIKDRLEKMSNELMIYNREQIEILSSGKVDLNLRRSTENPSIGIEFFEIDDENFQEKFEDQRYEELVYIRGRSKEETIYCILNELWRLNDKRPIYIVNNLESWNRLQSLELEGNVYIPWFYADEIIAIENNTNIFALDENTPVFGKNVLELRPRTYNTLLRCLEEAGMEYEKAYNLLSDTHGLYIQIKKQLFRGEYLKQPLWINGISEKAKKTCLLIGSWEEIDGDKLIIELLYGDSYDKFADEILPYTKGEDPFLYMVNRNGSNVYYLASTENVWSYFNVLTSEAIWKLFETAVLNVINEAESLFVYNATETIDALFKGERLFWSETIRKGMLKTLLIKAAYQKDDQTQIALNKLIGDILDYVKTEKQWVYISKFWGELCEISPTVVLKRIENEFSQNTGLLCLFENQSRDVFLERNAYIDILWGIEQFLVQKEYFWPAFRWILRLDSYNYEYQSNSVKDLLSKVFCTWMNLSALQTAEDKITAAEISFEINYFNTWDHLYSAINSNDRLILGQLSLPKYREYNKGNFTSVSEMQKTNRGYFRLLMKYMDSSVDRWKNMVNLSVELSEKLRKEVFIQLVNELNQMSDEEVMKIKNEIRHLIYRHRYFASADWSISEEKVVKYEKLLDVIRIGIPEYEYSYLFINEYEYPLMHPVPYDQEGKREENQASAQELIRKKLEEFQASGYDLTVLVKACIKESNSSLGMYLAKYWDRGKWNFDIFKMLLSVQESGKLAIDYLEDFARRGNIDYSHIIGGLSTDNCPIEILAKIYRIEILRTKDIPLIAYASEAIKKEFWKNFIFHEDCNDSWVLAECKKYASFDIYLNQVHQIHYNNPLSPEEIYQCFEDIEYMPQNTKGTEMTSYHLKDLLGIIQDFYINDIEKCMRISQLEIFFMNLLDGENMKCFRHIIKQNPKPLTDIIAVVFKRDHGQSEEKPNNQVYIQNMYRIYDKVHFCPAENNGEVLYDQLDQWISMLRQLLIKNDQERLFTAILGRLFSFSPLGSDGHEPCEAVRMMIEQYGDNRMISCYQTAVYNRRGVFYHSNGKEELRIAEEFKENAEYLEPRYPKTAKIFYGLYDSYKKDADCQRVDAENGWE